MKRACLLVSVVIVVPLLLAACAGSADDAATEPATVEPIDGTDLSRVTLTREAASRLDIQTASVAGGAGGRTMIPYAALVYSPTGETFAYTNPAGLTFVRAEIVVDRIDGDRAVLSKGPAPGTKVATVGVAELHGAESGVGADSGH
jgi:hypothetical protein